MMKRSLICAALFMAASAPAFAQDQSIFAAADALFALRDQGTTVAENKAATLEARAAYQKIIDDGAADSDLVRAVEGIARTYYFMGDTLHPKGSDAENKARKAVFKECGEAVESISPENYGEATPVYYYWKASCLALEAEVSGIGDKTKLAGELEKIETATKAAYYNAETEEWAAEYSYEGGGIDRVIAAVKGNVLAVLVGKYFPEEAKTLIAKSLVTEGYSPFDDVEAIPGSQFCANYFREAKTFADQGNFKNDATLKAAAIEKYDALKVKFEQDLADGVVPEVLRAETANCLAESAKARTEVKL